MKVLKFGGSSVGSASIIQSVLKIISRAYQQDNKIVLVFSAMQGVTRSLQHLLAQAAGGEPVDDTLKQMETQHCNVLRAFVDNQRQQQACAAIELLFGQLRELLGGVRALGEVSLRARDKVLSFGELLSCSMMCPIIDQHIAATVFADARRFIKTNGDFGKAIVDYDLSYRLVSDFHAETNNSIVVFTGFIASNEKGDTTTLGFGGSDYTAAIVGAALNASEVQIWTDVDGIMTADPRIVNKAFSILGLTYLEAIELSYFGARVIHPPAMLPAQSRNIPMVIRNTFNPSFEGTMIAGSSASNGSYIKGISFIPETCLVTIQGGGMVGYKGFSGRLFTALARADVNVVLITQASSEHSISLAISPPDLSDAIQAIRKEFNHELLLGQIDEPRMEQEMSIIAVVGENMRHTKGLSGRLFSALGRSGVNVVTIAQGSSELNISVVIDRRDLHKAMNSVHDAMFLSPVRTLNVFCAGVGNIGKTFLRQIESQKDHLEQKRQVRINLAGICNSTSMLFDSEGISLAEWETLFKERAGSGSITTFVERASEMNLPNSVFIDNTGSDLVARLYSDLFRKSISVVACNKRGVSGPFMRYLSDKQVAQQFGVDFWYETSVGAGLPIIKTLYDLLISGDKVLRIEAVLSGTFSYIFNHYRGQRTFASVVREAMEKGLTEPDPRDDLSGLDFVRKMLILARETGLQVEVDDIRLQSLLPQTCLEAASVDDFFLALEAAEDHFAAYKHQASEEDKVLQFVGILEEGIARIELLLLGREHPFYNLTGSDNIVSFTTNRYLNNPMVIKGPGAGAEVTAAGVMADLIRVAAQ